MLGLKKVSNLLEYHFKHFSCFVIRYTDMYEGRAYMPSSATNQNAALPYFVDMCEGRADMTSSADFFDQ